MKYFSFAFHSVEGDSPLVLRMKGVFECCCCYLLLNFVVRRRRKKREHDKNLMYPYFKVTTLLTSYVRSINYAETFVIMHDIFLYFCSRHPTDEQEGDIDRNAVWLRLAVGLPITSVRPSRHAERKRDSGSLFLCAWVGGKKKIFQWTLSCNSPELGESVPKKIQMKG